MRALNDLIAKMKDLWRDEDGQGMVEYILLLALIVVVLLASVTLLRDQISGYAQRVTQAIGNADNPARP